MSTVSCRVDRRLPVSVVRLGGLLTPSTLPDARAVLRDCLAEMPAALVIDVAGLGLDTAGWSWLRQVAVSAERWPVSRVLVTGPGESLNGRYAPLERHLSVEAALAALGDVRLPQRRQVVLPPVADACGKARELVVRACADWGMRRPVKLAELLVSELVANGVRHARTDIRLTVRQQGESLELCVRDDDPTDLRPEIEQEDPRGFGLQLVAALSDDWGWTATGRGKVVWTRLPGVG